MSEKLLEVKNLRVSYHTYAGEVQSVRGVSFTVNKGETVAVVGESGCGKSVTAKSIMRLIKTPPAEIKEGSEIIFDGEDVLQFNEKRLCAYRGGEVAMVFQDALAALNPTMTVGNQIIENLRHHTKLSKKEAKARAVELLRMVGIPQPESRVDQYPHEFSGGQRQRVGIARAFALKPKLIICDEPVSALDVSIQAQVLNLLKELQDKFGTAYLFIAHDLSVVQHISDRVAVMYLGKMVEVSDWKTLYSEPHHPYTQSLLSAVPVPDPDIQKTRKRIILAGDPPSPLDPPTGCRFHTRCPIAQGICSEKLPEFKEVAPGHCCACHFAEPFPIKESHIDL